LRLDSPTACESLRATSLLSFFSFLFHNFGPIQIGVFQYRKNCGLKTLNTAIFIGMKIEDIKLYKAMRELRYPENRAADLLLAAVVQLLHWLIA